MGINISVMGWMDHANVLAQTTHASYPLTHPVHHYHYYICLMAFFQDDLGKLAPEK